MTAFVILFRGVGGATRLPMAPLSKAGHQRQRRPDERPAPPPGTVAEVAAICARRSGFRKDIHARTQRGWEELVARNPFPEAARTPAALHAAVLAAEPERVAALRALAEEGDRIALAGRVAYLHTPNGFGRSRLATRFDRGLGVANTARNWNTVLKLRALACAAAEDDGA